MVTLSSRPIFNYCEEYFISLLSMLAWSSVNEILRQRTRELRNVPIKAQEIEILCELLIKRLRINDIFYIKHPLSFRFIYTSLFLIIFNHRD